MNINAITNIPFNTVSFNAKRNTMPKLSDLKEDTFVRNEDTRNSRFRETAVKLAEDCGFSRKEIKRLKNAADMINASKTDDHVDSMLLMMSTQEDYNFQNIDQLIAFSILSNSYVFYEEEIESFIRDEEKFAKFSQLVGLADDFNSKDSRIEPQRYISRAVDIFSIVQSVDKDDVDLVYDAYKNFGFDSSFFEFVNDPDLIAAYKEKVAEIPEEQKNHITKYQSYMDVCGFDYID